MTSYDILSNVFCFCHIRYKRRSRVPILYCPSGRRKSMFQGLWPDLTQSINVLFSNLLSVLPFDLFLVLLTGTFILNSTLNFGIRIFGLGLRMGKKLSTWWKFWVTLSRRTDICQEHYQGEGNFNVCTCMHMMS